MTSDGRSKGLCFFACVANGTPVCRYESDVRRQWLVTLRSLPVLFLSQTQRASEQQHDRLIKHDNKRLLSDCCYLL